MTIPRLKLRAALLASRLLQFVAKSLNIKPSACHAWTDSQIVIHSLGPSDSTGNSSVDDYISHIQELTECYMEACAL